MMRRDALEALTPALSSLGYQVLLDLIATARGRLRIVELARAAARGRPLGAQARARAARAADREILQRRGVDPLPAVLPGGLSGVGVHLALLDAALIALSFTAAQTFATIG